MVVVTNRIKVKKGMAARMAPAFTAPGPLDTFEGFHKVEVLVAQHEDHDELNVNMYWDTLEQFTTWRNSDAFKASHKRPEPGSEEAKKESPILGSQIVISDVAAVKEIAAK
ncbi:MAG: heme oxygenase [Bacillus sp. (in: firmicutes)]